MLLMLCFSRFPKRILLNLPDDAGRFNLIKSILRKYCLAKGLTDSDIRFAFAFIHTVII